MLGELIELGQACSSASAFEAAALGFLQREVGFDVAYFTVKGDEADPTVVALDRPLVERAIARGATYMEELLPVKRAALAARGVAVDTEVLGLARVRETQYFRELAAPVGGQHSLMAYLHWRNEVVAAIMLGRASPFSGSEVRRVESCLSGIALGRAAFGLPWVSGPLRSAGPPSLFGRLGAWRRTRPLASIRTPSGTLVVQDRRGFREMLAVDGRSELVWTRSALAVSARGI